MKADPRIEKDHCDALTLPSNAGTTMCARENKGYTLIQVSAWTQLCRRRRRPVSQCSLEVAPSVTRREQ